MKTFLLSAIGSLGIAVTGAVYAQDQDQSQPKNPKNKPTTTAQPKRVNPAPYVKQPYRTNPSQPRTARHPVPQNQPYPKAQYSPGPSAKVRGAPDQAREYDPKARNAFVPAPNPPIQRDPATRNQDLQDRARRHNWQDNDPNHNPSHRPRWQNHPQYESWAEARRRCSREHHDHNWWRSHYTRFVIFGGGYYYWNAGYWYPAYGFDPGYNAYDYEEPIYAPNDIDPSEVIASVQTELQQLGYYEFEVDGQMGPETRRAITNYQRDNGLEITSAIDQPTLQSLGLE